MTTSEAVPPRIAPLASMEEAWAEYDRLWAESSRLRAESVRLRVEGDLVVVFTAEALYGEKAVIDWDRRTVKT